MSNQTLGYVVVTPNGPMATRKDGLLYYARHATLFESKSDAKKATERNNEAWPDWQEIYQIIRVSKATP